MEPWAGMALELRLLGDIEARVNDRPVDIGHARQRSVLAALLAEPNRPIPVGRLVDRVWGQGRMPTDPVGAIRTYVSLLRRALTGYVAITARTPGYTAVVDEQRVDLHLFRSLLAQARAAADEHAAGLFEQALRLWRGEPFAGLDTPWINAARQALSVDRQTARLDLFDIRLRLGRHTSLLAELTHLAAAHPLDERVAGQLMLALYHSGRQGDALAQYHRIRRQLTDELGVDPGAALQRLHQGILAADPRLAPPVAPGSPVIPVPPAAPVPPVVPAPPVALVPPVPPVPSSPVMPRQLPAAPRGFTGRARELAALTAALDEPAEAERALLLSVIAGSGGIGKTWLALHWAHRHVDRFPDGQLYVNLRGYDPSGQPVDPAFALRGILGALGVAPDAIPGGLEARAGLYRSLVADRRMLILLDNALDAGQVTPLLPGTAACTVLVTSRCYLGALVAGHGARCVELDVLSDAEARQVLVRYLGQDRVAAEPLAVAELVACCAGLPLALGIAAARADRRPAFPLTALAAELRDRSGRLDALDAGDPAATARAVLSWSIRALSPAAVSTFGLIALAPGPDLSLSAAASLLALPVAATREPLRELEDASLLQQHAPGRYRMHDLVRLLAAEQAGRDGAPATQDAAVRRVTDFYLHSSFLADRAMSPLRSPIRLAPAAAGVVPCVAADGRDAMAWFEAEHLNLLATQQAAAAHGWHTEVWQLAWTLTSFHARRGDPRDTLAVWQAALGAAARLADPAARVRAHRYLGIAHADLGRHRDAIEHLSRALAVAEQHHCYAELAHTHLKLAWAWNLQRDDRRGLQHATLAAQLYRDLGQPVHEAQALNAMGWHAAHLGDYATARIHCQIALALHRSHGSREAEALTLDSLGYIDQCTGRHQQAVGRYRQALGLLRTLGNTYESAGPLVRLGETHAALSELPQARAAWREALGLYAAQCRDADADRVRQRLDAVGDSA